jgi:serine/threonine-protein kinase
VLPADDDQSIHDLFQRELTVWAGLDHLNIIRLNEILETRSDGWVAAMDWCVGSLGQFLNEHTTLPIEAASFILHDVVEGLHFAFSEHGLLHLDLKPANILYKRAFSRNSSDESDPVRKYAWNVSDWGLASVKNATLAKLTSVPAARSEFATLNNLGTVAYMAPERFVHGVSSSVASDLFAVGLVFYEMLIGCLPYQKLNLDVASQICSHSYFHTAKLALNQQRIPKPISEIILRLITPDPVARHMSYQELLERLARFQRPNSLLSRLFKF